MKLFKNKKVQFVFGVTFLVAFFALMFTGNSDVAWAVTILPTTALTQINLEMEEAWANNQLVQEMGAVEADSFARFLRSQATLGQGLIRPLTDPDKDNLDVRVTWVDFCGDAAEDCAADNYCDGIDSTTAGVDFKDYGIKQCITDDFKVSETTFAGSTMDMQNFIRQSQQQKLTNIVNRLNMKTLLFLHATAGFNRGTAYPINLQNQVEVPAADFKPALITDMIIDAKMSKIINPYVLDGRNLMRAWIDANFDSAEQQGAARRTKYFDVTSDPFGFASAGAPVVNSTFLVTPYVGAFVTKNYYQNTAPEYDRDLGMEKYSINIPAFNIRVDVLHQRRCENAKKDRWSHVWKYTAHYDFLQNPFGCVDVNGKRVTGVIEYTKVA